MADARAARRTAEACRRDGRGHARVPQRARVSALARAGAGGRRTARLHADGPGALRAGHRRIPRRATRQDALLERLQADRPLVGRASSLLALRHNRRVVAFAVLAVALGVYYAVAEHLWNSSLWWDVAWITLVLFPAVFGLVWLALPLWRGETWLLPVGGARWGGAAGVPIAGGRRPPALPRPRRGA